MTNAIVKKAFKGVPDNYSHGVQYNVGDMVSGRLAEVAMREGWAEPLDVKPDPPKKKATASARGPSSRQDRPLLKVKSAKSRPQM